jgi:hypothetical protein
MYKVGQKIIFVDEPGHGLVLEIRPKNMFLIEDEHGFSRTYPADKIAAIRVPLEKLEGIKHVPQEKAVIKPKKTIEKHNAVPEVIDLHIHELVDRHEHWSNSEIVNYQMDHLKKKLEQVMNRRVKCVHIVHGVGEGKLRSEVRQFLRKFSNCEINDLSYTRNGFGATEFVIRYKGNV